MRTRSCASRRACCGARRHGGRPCRAPGRPLTSPKERPSGATLMMALSPAGHTLYSTEPALPPARKRRVVPLQAGSAGRGRVPGTLTCHACPAVYTLWALAGFRSCTPMQSALGGACSLAAHHSLATARHPRRPPPVPSSSWPPPYGQQRLDSALPSAPCSMPGTSRRSRLYAPTAKSPLAQNQIWDWKELFKG